MSFHFFCLCVQLLQISPILCSTWTTTSSTGKAWMRGSCTACDRLQSRHCSVRPGTLWSGVAVLSPAGVSLSLPAQPAKGPPRLHSPASVARQAFTCPSKQKPQKDFLTGSCSGNIASSTTLSDENCDKQTRTHKQHPYELLVPLRHSQCSWSGDITERGSLQASWQSIRPLITTWALLFACEVAVE